MILGRIIQHHLERFPWDRADLWFFLWISGRSVVIVRKWYFLIASRHPHWFSVVFAALSRSSAQPLLFLVWSIFTKFCHSCKFSASFLHQTHPQFAQFPGYYNGQQFSGWTGLMAKPRGRLGTCNAMQGGVEEAWQLFKLLVSLLLTQAGLHTPEIGPAP